MIDFLNELNIDFSKFVLKESDFKNYSDLHGIMHTFRVMFNCLLIGSKINDIENTKVSFSAAYIHDLSRRHDGYCEQHGKFSIDENFEKYKSLFLSIGLNDDNLESLKLAVIYHSLREELNKNHKHYKPVSLLKDADALDRVRIDDLDIKYLRYSESKNIVKISENLYINNIGKIYYNFQKFLEDNLV
jgi:hypothetical protein